MAQQPKQSQPPPQAPAPVPVPAPPKPRRNIGSVLGAIATAVLALFLLQNLQNVHVHFLWLTFSTRLTWALLAAAAFGIIALGVFPSQLLEIAQRSIAGLF